MTGIVIKDSQGNYFCGLKKWDKQLRKAQIYVSRTMAIKMCNSESFRDKHIKLVEVSIEEVRDLEIIR